MAPKKQNAAERKATDKKKDKVIEDKTFGLKNKNKSKTVQKYIASVKQSVKQVPGQRPTSEHEARQEKKKETERAKLLNSLFGNLGILETKKKKKPKEEDNGKIDLYVDQREQQGDANETMENWDQAQLEKVVGQRHGNQARQCQTDIVCKYFLDAVESNKYGWFWVCPNGGDACKYRHSLPPGYVLKKQVPVDDEDDDEEQLTIEEIIENERAALPSGGTQVTEETFKAWLKRNAELKREAAEKERQAIIEASSKKDQRGIGLSGRDLFTFDPSLFVDDDGAAGHDLYGDLEDATMVFTEEPDLYADDVDLDDIEEEEDEEELDDEEEDEAEPHIPAPVVASQ
jgi:hypothetical protein